MCPLLHPQSTRLLLVRSIHPLPLQPAHLLFHICPTCLLSLRPSQNRVEEFVSLIKQVPIAFILAGNMRTSLLLLTLGYGLTRSEFSSVPRRTFVDLWILLNFEHALPSYLGLSFELSFFLCNLTILMSLSCLYMLYHDRTNCHDIKTVNQSNVECGTSRATCP